MQAPGPAEPLHCRQLGVLLLLLHAVHGSSWSWTNGIVAFPIGFVSVPETGLEPGFGKESAVVVAAAETAFVAFPRVLENVKERSVAMPGFVEASVAVAEIAFVAFPRAFEHVPEKVLALVAVGTVVEGFVGMPWLWVVVLASRLSAVHDVVVVEVVAAAEEET